MLVGWEVPNVDELTSPFPPNKGVNDIPPQGRSGGAGRTCAAAGGEPKGARERTRSTVICRSVATSGIITIPPLAPACPLAT